MTYEHSLSQRFLKLTPWIVSAAILWLAGLAGAVFGAIVPAPDDYSGPLFLAGLVAGILPAMAGFAFTSLLLDLRDRLAA